MASLSVLTNERPVLRLTDQSPVTRAEESAHSLQFMEGGAVRGEFCQESGQIVERGPASGHCRHLNPFHGSVLGPASVTGNGRRQERSQIELSVII